MCHAMQVDHRRMQDRRFLRIDGFKKWFSIITSGTTITQRAHQISTLPAQIGPTFPFSTIPLRETVCCRNAQFLPFTG